MKIAATIQARCNVLTTNEREMNTEKRRDAENAEDRKERHLELLRIYWCSFVVKKQNTAFDAVFLKEPVDVNGVSVKN